MKKVITYGTFDLLHYGHINLLRRAKELGDWLVVALSTDEFNAIKGKKVIFHMNNEKNFLMPSNMLMNLFQKVIGNKKFKTL